MVDGVVRRTGDEPQTHYRRLLERLGSFGLSSTTLDFALQLHRIAITADSSSTLSSPLQPYTNRPLYPSLSSSALHVSGRAKAGLHLHCIVAFPAQLGTSGLRIARLGMLDENTITPFG